MNKNMTLGELLQRKTMAEETISNEITNLLAKTGVPIRKVKIYKENADSNSWETRIHMEIPGELCHDWNYEEDWLKND